MSYSSIKVIAKEVGALQAVDPPRVVGLDLLAHIDVKNLEDKVALARISKAAGQCLSIMALYREFVVDENVENRDLVLNLIGEGERAVTYVGESLILSGNPVYLPFGRLSKRAGEDMLGQIVEYESATTFTDISSSGYLYLESVMCKKVFLGILRSLQ